MVDLSIRPILTLGDALPSGHHDIPHSIVRSRDWMFRALAVTRGRVYAEWRRFPQADEQPDLTRGAPRRSHA
jgi:hypothetical protein